MGQSKDSLQHGRADAIVPDVNSRLIVQKFGGSSLSSPERVRAIAGRIAERAADGTRMVITVSAMGRTTDELIALAHEVTPSPSQRELDMLLSVGERISMALLSMALNANGCSAISFTGSQSGIVTTVRHNRALIEEIRGDRIREELDRGRVVIVAGFQGVSREREITTLGRGGSDTTAVALAATLRADCCEIYSDYPGVFTADPRWVPAARPIAAVSYDELLELAGLGAKVLHYRAADLARRYEVPLRLAASFKKEGETIVSNTVSMESARATSVTCNREVCAVTVTAKNDKACRGFLESITGEEVRLICYHKASSEGRATLDVVVTRDDADIITGVAGTQGLDVKIRNDLASVSIVGSGLATTAGSVLEVERALDSAGIPVTHAEKSTLSITCLVPRNDCKRAVEALHARFIERS
jgi:aspartate kinase